MHPRTTRFRITFIHLRIPSQDDICRVQRKHGEAARRHKELPLPERFKFVYSTIVAYRQLKPCLTFSERNQCIQQGSAVAVLFALFGGRTTSIL